MPNHALTRRLFAGAVCVVSAIALTSCGGVKTTAGGDGETTYPSGSIEMTVGASAGGGTDLITRALANGMSSELGVPIPVVNKPGANSALNARELAAAEADGYTASVQYASLFTITPLAVSETEATTIDSFDVVTGLSRDEYVLVTTPQSGFTNIDDLTKAGHTIRYATAGVGSATQLAPALTFKTAGIDATAVPFDGNAPALTAQLGNHVDVSTLQIGEGMENIKSGKLVPLAVFSKERVVSLPDVETATEQGFDVQVSQYRFLTVPKGTPQAAKTVLLEAARKTFDTPAYKKLNEDNSLTPMEVSGDEVVASLKTDAEKYQAQVARYDISLAAE